MLCGYRFDPLTLVLSRAHSQKTSSPDLKLWPPQGEIPGSASRDRGYDIVERDGNKVMQLMQLNTGVTSLAPGKRPLPPPRLRWPVGKIAQLVLLRRKFNSIEPGSAIVDH